MEGKGPGWLVNGDEIRNVRFGERLGGGDGYDASQVDDLLTRIAAELDAGRPAGPVHPGLPLTDELALTILVSAPWLDERFQPEPHA